MSEIAFIHYKIKMSCTQPQVAYEVLFSGYERCNLATVANMQEHMPPDMLFSFISESEVSSPGSGDDVSDA